MAKKRLKTAKQLATLYEKEHEEDYFELIIESIIYGHYPDAKDRYLSLTLEDRKACLLYLVNELHSAYLNEAADRMCYVKSTLTHLLK